MTAFRFPSVCAAFVTAVFAIVPTSLFAQGGMLGGMQGDGINSRPFKVVVNGGLTVTNGDLKLRNDNGFHFAASVVYKFRWLPIAVRPEVSYTQFRFKTASLASPLPDEKNYTRALTALGHIEYPFPSGVYVFGGLGALNLESVIARDSADRKATSLMMDVGAGYRFDLGQIQWFLEARFGSASADKTKFVYSRASIVPLSFGFVF